MMQANDEQTNLYVSMPPLVGVSSMIKETLETAASSETAAQALFITLRWPTGVICCPWGNMPITESQIRPHISRGQRFYCSACDRPFTSTTRTAIHGTKIPLHKWVKASALFATCGGTISLAQMEHELALSRRTCWMMRNKIRALTHNALTHKKCAQHRTSRTIPHNGMLKLLSKLIKVQS